MKTKDAIMSLLAGYAVTTLPIWEVRESIWIVGAMAAVLFWDVLIRIEEFQEKRNGAQGAATPKTHNRKLYTTKL